MVRPILMLLFLALGACQPVVLHVGGVVEGQACDLESDGTVCELGLTCAPVQGQNESQCANLFEIRGQVVDALSLEPIEGARVAAFDASGIPISDVVATDAGGRYVLPVVATRNPDGLVSPDQSWTLFAAASDYHPFPGGVRPSLPLEASGVETETDGRQFLENATTTVALFPNDVSGATIEGRVGERGEGAGALVVAEAEAPSPYGVADRSGRFFIFNVRPGAMVLRAYKAGIVAQSVEATVAGEDLHIDLAVDEGSVAMGEVSGSVNIVNAQGGLGTSVVLVPTSVFEMALERGPVPVGLRNPDPGSAPDLTGSFVISGVPPGNYAVLAAFENDGLVRDPDESIAGTQIQYVEVAAGESVSVETAFKVTEAIAILSPGAEGLEEVSGEPTFTWVDDSSETHYTLVVLDALGSAVWETMVPMANGGNVELVYGGTALERSMIYQFRVTAWRETPQAVTALSRTEDLLGLFTLAP